MAWQYLTHAHCHITRAVAAMDSCFGLVMTSSAWHSRRAEIGLQALCSLPFTAEAGTEGVVLFLPDGYAMLMRS